MTSPNDLSPVFDHPSTESTHTEPSQTTSDSYFPSSHRSSFSSNSSSAAGPEQPTIITSAAAVNPPVLRPVQPARAATTTAVAAAASSTASAGHRPVVFDALSRTFPKPVEDVTLDEMLARPPQKWSVGHYVKNARDARIAGAAQDKDVKARQFAQAKRELLAAKEAMEKQQWGGGR